jgi:hypothetical protein
MNVVASANMQSVTWRSRMVIMEAGNFQQSGAIVEVREMDQ